MKILHTADIHINLRRNKKINTEWQRNRFVQFFDTLLELETIEDIDINIIAGDIFDKAPTLEESTLFEDYANKVKKRTIIIPGNHEATKKGKSFLDSYIQNNNAITNNNIEIYTNNTRIEHLNQGFQLFPYTDMQLNNVPQHSKDDILITHIRGEIPPHITAEFDFEKLRDWKLILLGDIHVNMKYKDFPAYYSGSPLNVSFDRDDNKKYGVNIIDFTDINNYTVHFRDLKLPKLIRKTVSADAEIVSDSKNNIIYEVTGSIDELQKIKENILIDKKIAKKPNENSVIDLTNSKDIQEELTLYLKYNSIDNVDNIIKTFNDLNLHV